MNHIIGNIDIHTERLLMRHLKESDVEGFFEIFNDKDVMKNFMCIGLQEKESVKQFVNSSIEKAEKEPFYFWAIELNGEMIGFVNMCDKVESFSRCEVGYCLRKAYRGHGYASEALKGVLEYLTNTVGYNKVSAAYFIDNEASGNVMRSAGMILEGTRKADVFYQDRFIDCVYYYYMKK